MDLNLPYFKPINYQPLYESFLKQNVGFVRNTFPLRNLTNTKMGNNDFHCIQIKINLLFEMVKTKLCLYLLIVILKQDSE